MRIQRHLWRGVATVAVCALGAFAMWITNGQTGVGLAIIGVMFIWIDV